MYNQQKAFKERGLYDWCGRGRDSICGCPS
jgi:hypothetical protein